MEICMSIEYICQIREKLVSMVSPGKGTEVKGRLTFQCKSFLCVFCIFVPCPCIIFSKN